MSVFHPHTVSCTCGAAFSINLADSINVKRSPAARAAILKGELHRGQCPSCGQAMTVERPFYYTDAARGALFKVLPRNERHRWKEMSKNLDHASAMVPGSVMPGRNRTLRVIFGLDELREKLLAQDAGIDDRALEMLKVMLVHEHPVLLRRARLRLALDRVDSGAYRFVAAYEHHPQRLAIGVPRAHADKVLAAPKSLDDWSGKAHRDSVFKLPDHWVNIWRWSPQPSALDRLRGYAAALEAGQTIDTGSADFRAMLKALPRGSHLPGWAKKDLRTLFEFVKTNDPALEDLLFEIRFGVELEDDWALADRQGGTDRLWQLLKDLPDNDVEGNARIHEIMLNVGEGGGIYDPGSHDISIGSDELKDKERFEDVVRHEVGHAVHEKNRALVDGFLRGTFGWRRLPGTDSGIDAWIAEMGGWGDLTTAQRGDVRGALRQALGRGEVWTPGPAPSMPAAHPWNRKDFGPRLAFERSGGEWYRHYASWFRTGGKAFALNYWYAELMVVNEDAMKLVAKMPDNYAAMSDQEFFAELYALYHDLDDPKRPNIPAPVMQWFADNLGKPEPGAPARPPARTPARPPGRATSARAKAASTKSGRAAKKPAAKRPLPSR